MGAGFWHHGHTGWRARWRDDLVGLFPVACVAALAIVAALTFGYLTADTGGPVATESAPTVLKPTDSSAKAPVQLRLQRVSIPGAPRPPLQSISPPRQNEGVAPAQQPDAPQPSSPSSGFDSVG